VTGAGNRPGVPSRRTVMRSVAIALFASLVLVLAACGEQADPADSPAGGVRGVVTSGPQCPVVVAGSPCPDRPWQGTVRISASQGDVVREVETDERGRFEVALGAGSYIVVAVTDPEPMATGSPRTVTVADGAWTEVSLLVDTGIR
jgi:hypothetical protein